MEEGRREQERRFFLLHFCDAFEDPSIFGVQYYVYVPLYLSFLTIGMTKNLGFFSATKKEEEKKEASSKKPTPKLLLLLHSCLLPPPLSTFGFFLGEGGASDVLFLLPDILNVESFPSFLYPHTKSQ